jgi:hypothetical protein
MGNPIKFISGLFVFFISFLFYSFTSNYNNFAFNTESLDSETVNWLARVDSAGGNVSDSIISAVDDYVKEVKGLKFQSLNIRNQLLRENWFCGDFTASFIPVFINSSGSGKDVNHNYQISEYNETGPESGLKGNGTDRYIETGFNPAAVNEISVNDVHMMIYSMSDSTDPGRMGCRKDNGGIYFYPRYLNGTTYFAVNSELETSVNLPSSRDYILFQRYSSQFVNAYYKNNEVINSQKNSTIKPNSKILIGAFNDNEIVKGYTSFRLGGYSIGKSFSSQQQLIHYNAVQRLMSKLGRKNNDAVSTEFKSKLFTFTGSNLVINYKTESQGSLQFEIQDSNGISYDEFSLDNCIPLSGNSYMQTVYWNSGNNISSLVNTPVYLKIRMKDADLYSIQFQSKVAESDSSVNGFKAGTYKQFFADTLLFAGSIPVMRKMNIPVKNPEPVISPTEPFEGNALITSYSNIAYSKSPVTGEMTYKMWLLIRNSLGGFPAYYESSDGISWTKPNLESFKYNGNMNNNILSDARPPAVITVVDDSAHNQYDSTRRYKSVYNYHTTAANSRLYVSFSYDGLVWIPYSGNPVRYIGEDLSTSGWNPVLGKYLGYFRDSLGIRKVGRYISDDWINWTYTGTVLKPDASDIKTTHFYNMTVLFKDSVYWGFAGVLRLNEIGDENPPSPSRTDNTSFIALLFSRDGINFIRCGNTQPFINFGELGSWDDQMVYTIGVPLKKDNEFYIYYNGFNFKHFNNGNPPPPADGGPMKSHIGLAKIGLDRFISLSTY